MQNVTVNARGLKEALGLAAKVAPKRSTLPILSNVLLRAECGTLSVIGTDIDTWVVGHVPCDQTAASMAVNAKLLSDTVKSIKTQDVTLGFDHDAKLLRVDGFSLDAISSDDYPALPGFPLTDKTGSIETENLEHLLKKTIGAASDDATRYHLNGVFMEVEAGAFICTATDGHRLHHRRQVTSGQTLHLSGKNWILPKSSVKSLIAAASKSNGAMVEVYESGQMVSFDFASSRVIVRTAESIYPNYRQIMPQNFTADVTIDAETVRDAVKALLPFANRKSHGMAFDFTPGKITITAKNEDTGAISTRVVEFDHNVTMRIGFNGQYVIDALDTFEGAVSWRFTDNLGPCSMTNMRTRHNTAVIMPMRRGF